MTSKRRFMMVLGAALLALALTGQAQNASNWRVYKASDGLPETITTSVTIGAHGNVWAKHLDAAVSCMDGYAIKTIPSPGLGNNRIYESASGQIWTVAVEGLQQYKDGEWLKYAVPEIDAELHRNNASLFHLIPLYPAKQNHVLFLIPDALMEFSGDDPDHPQTTILRVASQTTLGRFSSMAVARDGGLWITGSNGLAKLPGPARNLKPETEWQEHPLDKPLDIQNLREPTEDDDGGVTALAETKEDNRPVLAYFDGQQWTTQPLPQEKIFRAWRGANKTWWAMNSYTLFQWRDGQKEISVNEEIPAHGSFDLAVQPGGVFWLATSDGLFRYAPLVWQTPTGTQNLNSVINALTEDGDGALWVASANSLERFRDNEWQDHPFPRHERRFSRAARIIRADQWHRGIGDGRAVVAIQSGDRAVPPGCAQSGNAPETSRFVKGWDALCPGLESVFQRKILPVGSF